MTNHAPTKVISSQEARFERRLNDLRNLRHIERDAVRRLEELADDPTVTEARFAAAERLYDDALGAVKTAAAELAVVWYED